MLNKNGVLAIGVCGLIVIAFSLAVFFLRDIERISTNIWALTFLLLSELVFFGGLIGLRFTGAKYNKTFAKAGITTALVLYFIATLISAFCAGAFRENLNTFILIELAIVAVFMIITIAIFAYSRGIAGRNEADIAKVAANEPKRGGF